MHPDLQLPHDTSAEIDQIETSVADQDKEGKDMLNVLTFEGRKNKNVEDCKRLDNVDDNMPLRKCHESGGVEIMKCLLDRRVLKDSINELVEQKLVLYASAQSWVGLTPLQMKLKPVGQNLIDDIWEDLENIWRTLYEHLQRLHLCSLNSIPNWHLSLHSVLYGYCMCKLFFQGFLFINKIG